MPAPIPLPPLPPPVTPFVDDKGLVTAPWRQWLEQTWIALQAALAAIP